MADGATQTRVRTWEDRSWISRDGLDLHYRMYAGPVEKPPTLCLPGLTRNARDFADPCGFPRW